MLSLQKILLLVFTVICLSYCTNTVILKKTKCQNGYYLDTIEIDESKDDNVLLCSTTVRHLYSIIHKQLKIKLLFKGGNFKIFKLDCKNCNHNSDSFILLDSKGTLKLVRENKNVRINIHEIEKLFKEINYTGSDIEEIKRVVTRIIELNNVASTNW